MLTAASAHVRNPRLYLQCRHKSTLSVINRALDASIRRNRRKSLDIPGRVDHDPSKKPQWRDPSQKYPPTPYRESRSPYQESRSRSDKDYRDTPARDKPFNNRPTNRHSDRDGPQHGNILDVPFTNKAHFTTENWNRLMAAVKDAEDDYIKALPRRPSTIPTYNPDEPNSTVELKRRLKKILKADIADVGSTLDPQKSVWLRLIYHLSKAIKTAHEKHIFIKGRQWFAPDDPRSATKAIGPPFRPSLPSHIPVLDEISVMSGDMLRDYLKEVIPKCAKAIVSGNPLEDIDVSSGGLGFSTKKANEDIIKLTAKEDKERRRLEEESRLDDEQLSTFVGNNKEKNEDRKNRNKEIQEPRERKDKSMHEKRDQDRDVYVSIPYTTAASEFLYGANVVTAALKAKRRKLYEVYIHSRAGEDTARDMRYLSRGAGVFFHMVDDEFLPKMDKMAQGRPHNGVILEASPLPTLPTLSLGKLNVTDTALPITLADQSAEEAAINGTPSSIPLYHSHTWRKPLVLLLDGILDPGNLGNILRTAHFYGVDAVAVCTNTCAPVNLPVVQKAASGAAEALTILSIPSPANFISTCKKNNWRIHAAVAPDAASAKSAKKNLVTSTMSSPLSRDPSILMIGAEGEGLRANLATKADTNVGISGFRSSVPQVDVGVDSLNVASSVAVLLEAFMRKPDNLEDVLVGTPKETDVGARIV